MIKICEICGKEFKPHKFHPRQRFCSKKCQWKAYHLRHREKRLAIWRSYRDGHREELRRKARERYRERAKQRIKESQVYPSIEKEFLDIVFLDKLTPDAYIPSRKLFCEIKLATTKKFMEYVSPSKHFDGLFFKAPGRKVLSIDDQIARYPKPLLVIVFDLLSGKEIARKLLKEKKGV